MTATAIHPIFRIVDLLIDYRAALVLIFLDDDDRDEHRFRLGFNVTFLRVRV